MIPVFAAAAWLLAATLPVEAVIFDATADPNYNTSAPTGALTNSGWQFEGQFNGFLGTAIAPHYFLAAQHIHGSIGDPFVLDGTNYHTTALYDDPSAGSDLRLWQVAERLPRYAPVYTGTNEVGAPMIVFGCGAQRGEPVVTAGLTNGWYWGTNNYVMRWGSNQVADILTDNGAPYLYATFDHGAGPDECHLSEGDSSGGVFILADGVWQLAGVNYAVDGYFSTNSAGDNFFNAALYDCYGFYNGAGTNWSLITNHVASGFWMSRVSAHYDWLTNKIPDFDSNANGIPDWWELQYSGNIHGLVATNDPDQTGFNNLQDWISRSNPTNPAAVFRIDSVQRTNNTATLSFQGWSNRLYQIYSCDALTNGNWQLVTTNAFAGNDGPTTWSDVHAPNSTSRFYRLQVSLPP